MTRRIGVLLLAALAFGFGFSAFASRPTRAADDKSGDKAGAKGDDKSADNSGETSAAAVVDKAVEALGGRAKLEAVQAATWQTKGNITLDGNDNAFTSKVALSGLHQYRQEFEGTFNGDTVKGVTVLDGQQGWRLFNGETHELDKDGVANERRTAYLQAAAADPLVLGLEGFQVEPAGEEKVGEGSKAKPAVVLKVTGPDGKTFKEYFDKESGLPVRQVAEVAGWDGQPYTQDITFSNFKEFDGIKKATHIELKRDGQKFITYDLTEFKPLTDKLPAERFAEPK